MPRRFASLAFLAFAGCNSSPPVSNPPPPKPFEANCTVGPAPADATKPAGRIDARSSILPGGRLLTPAGTLLDIGGYPIGLRILPGDRYAIVTDDAVHEQRLRLVDLEARDPMRPNAAEIVYPLSPGNQHAPGLFYGLAVGDGGRRIYVSNGGYDPIPDSKPKSMHVNTIEVFDVTQADPPALIRNEMATIKLAFTPFRTDFLQRVPSGIVLSRDEKRLYVACQSDNTLAIVNLEPGPEYGVEIGTAQLPGLAAYDVAVDERSHTAFISLWGGMRTDDGRFIEGVVPVDITNERAPIAAAFPISTGKAAEAELFLAGRIYVANADADTLSVIDAASRDVKTTPVTSSMILGATPNNLAIDPGLNGNPGRIYIANANENSVVVLDLQTLSILGHIPAGWYPTAIGVRSDGGLVIASARGLGTGPSDGKHDNTMTEGIVQVVPRPTDAELKQGTQTVLNNLVRPRDVGAKLTCAANDPAGQRFPLAASVGAPSPIKYVFFIIRENKTYDGVFGDLPGGNGDPSLMAFTPEMIPNARALAKEFVLLDNFYSHAELSIQGHEWTTGCIANDYVEKGWGATDDYGRGYRPTEALSTSVLGRLAYPGSDSIWVHLDKAGIPYHNYGEVTNLLGAKTVLDPGYPGVFFNNSIPDVKKAAYVLETIFGAGDQLEPFSYILLPNDHTSGTKIGTSHPASMMADNDEALGRFVDAISHSSLWEKSLIIAVEDDPGGLGDHVEQHRSICLMASPWLKRHYHSSSMFDLASAFKTLELVIGAPPLNIYDGNAAPMYELFQTTPDLTPYNFIPRKIPEIQNTPDDPLAEECSRMDFSKPDQVDLSRVFWKIKYGKDAEPPWLKQKRPRWIEKEVDLDGDGD